VKHHDALPYSELPEFFAELCKRDSISAKALAFTILTAARSGGYAALLWAKSKAQSPGERTKSGREHRVPLSGQALTLLRSLDYLGQNDDALLFPGLRVDLLLSVSSQASR